jgi:hypothetical protein
MRTHWQSKIKGPLRARRWLMGKSSLRTHWRSIRKSSGRELCIRAVLYRGVWPDVPWTDRFKMSPTLMSMEYCRVRALSFAVFSISVLSVVFPRSLGGKKKKKKTIKAAYDATPSSCNTNRPSHSHVSLSSLTVRGHGERFDRPSRSVQWSIGVYDHRGPKITYRTA